MTTATATLTATNIAGARWVEDAKVTGFAAARPAYGITNDQGQALSFNGTAPSVWDRKAIAQSIADTVETDGVTWIEVVA
jgi:hypothetical protein